jgi:OOP family OmpA-OmpF porin
MFVKKVLLSAVATLLISGCSVDQLINKLSNLGTDIGTGADKEYHSDKPLVLFILDTSGSMKEFEGKESKLDKAKKSIIDTINQIDRTRFNISLITFGTSIGVNRGCKSKVSIAPSNDFDGLLKKIQTIEAYGSTPLANAISLSNRVVKNIEKKMIILLSDGKETCGGSPVREARKLYERYGIKINLQVIGYAVDEATKRELKNISRIDKRWGYYDAKDSTSLNKAIDTILTKHHIRDSSIWVDANHFSFQFSTGSTILKKEYITKISKIYDYLKRNKKRIIIIGHTDSVGSKSKNMQLSIERANIVKDKLIELGIDADRIQARGDGENSPIASNDDEDGRRQNRRVEIQILD